jgi:hypothetical protein
MGVGTHKKPGLRKTREIRKNPWEWENWFLPGKIAFFKIHVLKAC